MSSSSPESLPQILHLRRWLGLAVVLSASVRWAIAATMEPVMAATLDWLWFHQTLTRQLVGGALILTAVTTIQLQPAVSK
jgi:drug/metabolite transporter (DMT)-like permease